MTKKNTYKTLLTKVLKHPVIASILSIALLIAVIDILSHKNSKSGTNMTPVYKVERGPLTISITEAGSLENKDQIIMKNESGRPMKIAFLLEEGTMVKEGDLIVELDSTDLKETQQNYDINVKNGEATLVAAQENLEIAKNQAKADIASAELAYKFAKLDQEKYIKGLHPQDLEKANSNITIAKENLQRAEQDYTWSKQLHEKGFITLKELQADELSVKQKEITLKQNKIALDILTKYSHPEELETLQDNVEQGEMALDRAKRKAKADVVKAQASLLAKKSELFTLKQKLDKINIEIEKSKIIAPASGMVVYATSGGSRRHSNNREPMDVGATVQFRQALIRMPTSSKMLAVISIQEASLPKLANNMPAVITIDALPGQVFSGKITKISILPDSTQAWLNPDLKVYRCEVELDQSDIKMRPDMNCQVKIVIKKHSDVISIPIQCVLQINGKPTVFIKTKNGFERRVVETGMDNNVMIHVLKGLDNGDEVMLSPPLEAATSNDKASGTEVAQVKNNTPTQKKHSTHIKKDSNPNQNRTKE